MGSYFGGELCAIDMNQDGDTETLLIGAPLFYGEQKGGRVFVYQKKKVGTSTLNGEGGSTGEQIPRLKRVLVILGDFSTPHVLTSLCLWKCACGTPGRLDF